MVASVIVVRRIGSPASCARTEDRHVGPGAHHPGTEIERLTTCGGRDSEAKRKFKIVYVFRMGNCLHIYIIAAIVPQIDANLGSDIAVGANTTAKRRKV